MKTRLRLATLAALAIALSTLVVVSPAQAAVLQAPTNVVAVQQDKTSIVVSWDLPPDNPTHPRMALLFAASVDGGAFNTLRNLPPNTTSWVDPEGGESWLTVGSSYVYRITAINYLGDQSEGALSQAVVMTSIATGPQDVTGSAAGDGTVSLSWNPPASDGGTPITSYSIYRSHPTTVAQYHLIGSASTTAPLTYVDNTVVPFTWYEYLIVPVNKWGESFYQMDATVVKSWLTPNNMRAATLRLMPGGEVRFTFTTGAVRSGEDSGFMLMEGGADTVQAIGQSTFLSVRYIPGTRHTVDLFGWNGLDHSKKAIRLTFTAADLPGAPRSVHVVSSKGQATLTWAPPKSNGYAAIKAYRITSVSTGLTKVVSANARRVVFNGLRPGVRHVFKVFAVNAVGTGAAASGVAR